MPLYEYACQDCGTFSSLRKMSESQLPAQCECGAMAERILSAPRLAFMDRGQRSAHERNEKSAHEPRTTRRSSCGCSGSHSCSSGAAKSAGGSKEGGTLKMQTKKTARPWMLGH
ncbi:MAG TPA: zinc ribbon domain-containing protein [Methylophilaceae bacterium]|nr:zinc ribbon domain-containing protein [Methylophilaceae bacterium]